MALGSNNEHIKASRSRRRGKFFFALSRRFSIRSRNYSVTVDRQRRRGLVKFCAWAELTALLRYCCHRY